MNRRRSHFLATESYETRDKSDRFEQFFLKIAPYQCLRSKGADKKHDEASSFELPQRLFRWVRWRSWRNLATLKISSEIKNKLCKMLKMNQFIKTNDGSEFLVIYFSLFSFYSKTNFHISHQMADRFLEFISSFANVFPVFLYLAILAHTTASFLMKCTSNKCIVKHQIKILEATANLLALVINFKDFLIKNRLIILSQDTGIKRTG